MRRVHILAAVAIITLIISACGGSGGSEADFRLNSASDGLAITFSPSEGGMQLLIELDAASDSGLIEGSIVYDTGAWRLESADAADSAGELLLVSAPTSGGTAFAAAMPGGAPPDPGPLALLKFAPGPESGREVQAVGPAPVDLAASVAGVYVSLTWTENLPGDCDMNGAVSGTDLFQIAISFGYSEGDALYNPDADCNGDGTVNGMDVFVIASNFNKSINGYDVYRKPAGSGSFTRQNSEPVERDNYGDSSPPQSIFIDTVSGPGDWEYAVRSLNTNEGSESPLSDTLDVQTTAAPLNSVIVAPLSEEVSVGGLVEVSILVNEVSDVFGISLVLDYDTDKLDFVDYRESTDFFTSTALYMTFGPSDPTVYLVAVELSGQSEPHDGSGEVATLVFRGVDTGEAYLNLRSGEDGTNFSDTDGNPIEPTALVSGGVTVGEGNVEPPDDPDDLDPPANPATTAGVGYVEISWDASDEQNLLGYNVYSAADPEGSYTRLNDNPVDGLDYIDGSASDTASNWYKVSAVADGYLESAATEPVSGIALPMIAQAVYVRAERATYHVGEIVRLELGVSDIVDMTGVSLAINFDDSLEYFDDMLAQTGPFEPLIYFPQDGDGWFSAAVANQGLNTSSGEGPVCYLDVAATEAGTFTFSYETDPAFTSLQNHLMQTIEPDEFYGFTITVE